MPASSKTSVTDVWCGGIQQLLFALCVLEVRRWTSGRFEAGRQWRRLREVDTNFAGAVFIVYNGA
jgi:hypothetical protein